MMNDMRRQLEYEIIVSRKELEDNREKMTDEKLGGSEKSRLEEEIREIMLRIHQKEHELCTIYEEIDKIRRSCEIEIREKKEYLNFFRDEEISKRQGRHKPLAEQVSHPKHQSTPMPAFKSSLNHKTTKHMSANRTNDGGQGRSRHSRQRYVPQQTVIKEIAASEDSDLDEGDFLNIQALDQKHKEDIVEKAEKMAQQPDSRQNAQTLMKTVRQSGAKQSHKRMMGQEGFGSEGLVIESKARQGLISRAYQGGKYGSSAIRSSIKRALGNSRFRSRPKERESRGKQTGEFKQFTAPTFGEQTGEFKQFIAPTFSPSS